MSPLHHSATFGVRDFFIYNPDVTLDDYSSEAHRNYQSNEQYVQFQHHLSHQNYLSWIYLGLRNYKHYIEEFFQVKLPAWLFLDEGF